MNTAKWEWRRGKVKMAARGVWPCNAVSAGVTLILLAAWGGIASSVVAQGTYTIPPSSGKVVESRASTPAVSRAGQNKKARVTLVVSDSTVQYAVASVARQAKLKVAYDKKEPMTQQRVSVRLVDMDVMEALGEILKGTGMTAVLATDQETIVIRQAVQDRSTIASATAVVGTIVGRVTDSATGDGIAGVTVTVQGTNIAVLTKSSGEFTLTGVPAGAQTVTFKLLGYTSVTRPVQVDDKKPVTVRIILKQTANMLSGVVTTATGEQRRKEIGNDVVSINVDSVMQVAPISTLTDLLESRVPGLTVFRSGGIPGAPSRIRIRGATSITQSNDPIIVVDGIRVYADLDSVGQQATNTTGTQTVRFASPSPIDQLDPNSIERIDVFKGPSAAAMYGSDAANGVIVVTTKRGRNGPLRWSVAANQGIEYMPGSYPDNEFVFGRNWDGKALPLDGIYLGTGYQLNREIDSVVRFQALNDSRYTVLGRGSKRDLSTTVSGGASLLDFSLTATVGREEGILKLPAVEVERYRKFKGVNPPSWMRRPDWYNTWAVSSTINMPIGQSARLSLVNRLFSGSQQQSSLNSAIQGLVGLYVDASLLDGAPLIRAFNDRFRTDNTRLTTSVGFSWKVASWLPLTGNLGLDVGAGTQSLYHMGSVIAAVDTTSNAQSGRQNSNLKDLNVRTVIPVGERVSLAIGINGLSQTTQTLNARNDFVPSGMEHPTIFTSATQTSSARNTFGWYTEPRFNFKSRFFANPGFRLDQNGLAGKGAGLGAFPKLNFSWLMSEENFFPFKGVVSQFRPRFSFGVAGTQPGATDRLRLYNQGLIPIAGALPTDGFSVNGMGVFVSSIGNQSVRPERSVEVEGGLDIDLWQNRVSLVFTRWSKTRHDAIVNLALAPSVGVNRDGIVANINDNIGVIRETGDDAMVSAQILENASIGWNVNASISRTRNSLVSFENDFVMPGFVGYYDAATRFVVGYPIFSKWAKPIAGYADANGNGIIDGNEVLLGDSVAYLGTPYPKFSMNGGTTISLLRGALSLNATLSYKDGLTQFTKGGSAQWLFGQYNEEFAKQAAASVNSDFSRVQVIDVLRFQSLGIRYRIPSQLSRRIRIPRMDVALQGANLGLWTNYRGKDPDVNGSTYGNELTDVGGIPEPRLWTIRFSVGN